MSLYLGIASPPKGEGAPDASNGADKLDAYPIIHFPFEEGEETLVAIEFSATLEELPESPPIHEF